MLKLFTAPLWKVLSGAFLILTLALGTMSWWESRQENVQTRNCQGIVMVVNDSTTATCARLRADKGELLALREAAKKMNGTPVAGVKIIIKRDTVYLPAKPVPTDTLPNQARVATVSDTTDEYQVTITAKAPTYPADLEIGYEIITPERTAEVGFVETRGGVYAVVSGRGITSTKAFYAPTKERPLTLWAGGAVRGNPLVPAASLSGDVHVALKYRRSDWLTGLETGLSDGWYIGIRLQKRLF